MKVIKDLEELKKLAATEDGCDCHIMLNFGLRSSKHIKYYEDIDSWWILNEIDGTEVSCVSPKLKDYSNIPLALERSALILDD